MCFCRQMLVIKWTLVLNIFDWRKYIRIAKGNSRELLKSFFLTGWLILSHKMKLLQTKLQTYIWNSKHWVKLSVLVVEWKGSLYANSFLILWLRNITGEWTFCWDDALLELETSDTLMCLKLKWWLYSQRLSAVKQICFK